MIIFVNGSFGIGKTTVAALLRERLSGCVVFNPEPVGVVLKYLSQWIPLRGRHTDDFQDIALWRRACVWGIRVLRGFRVTVIVPMTFSNLSYLREILAGLERSDPQVLHVCLVAPLPVVEQRLKTRAEAHGSPPPLWELRRAAECCIAHRAPEFAVHVSAFREPGAVAADVSALARALADESLQSASGAGRPSRFERGVKAARG